MIRSSTRYGVVLVLALITLVAACGPAVKNGLDMPAQPSQKTLSGEVTYRQRIALVPGAVIEVSLDDVSLADAPATRLGSMTITTKGENVPIPFTISYDASVVRPQHSYAVSARITIDNQLRWISTTRHSVLTQGNPVDKVTIVVQPVAP